MSSILGLLDRVRINVLQFFVPIGSRFIFWLRRKLNLTITCRQIPPPFPDPEVPFTELPTELADGSDMNVEEETEINPIAPASPPLSFYRPNVLARPVSPGSYDDFTASLRRTSSSTSSDFYYLFRNQNFSYLSDTDAGSPTINTDSDSD